MDAIPRLSGFDSSLAFLREGYGFISSRCERLGSDMFATRIMLTPVICMRGAEAAGFFYDGRNFTRVGAMPRWALYLLQDERSVQSLDDDAHRRRKEMFMAMMGPSQLKRLAEIFTEEWRAALPRWQRLGAISFYDEMARLLTVAAARWAGRPLAEDEIVPRTKELRAMVEGAGTVGPKNWHARFLRNRSERWCKSVIEEVRAGRLTVALDSPLGIIAAHEDGSGALLPAEVAAVELLNVLRPVAAIDRFMVFAALALHENPEWRDRFMRGGDDDLEPFVQEVRRFYPFFPVIGGKARRRLVLGGAEFQPGQWVLLDLYGTNHHPDLWPQPERFAPERFRGWDDHPNTLIPQGAGGYLSGHRCPGEDLTILLLKAGVKLLCRETRYDVPPQQLDVALNRMPALPESGFLMRQMGVTRSSRRQDAAQTVG